VKIIKVTERMSNENSRKYHLLYLGVNKIGNVVFYSINNCSPRTIRWETHRSFQVQILIHIAITTCHYISFSLFFISHSPDSEISYAMSLMSSQLVSSHSHHISHVVCINLSIRSVEEKLVHVFPGSVSSYGSRCLLQ